MGQGGWTNDILETLVITGPGGALVIINAQPIPPELVAYYAAGAPNVKTRPETIISVNQYFDGHGNYSYTATVIDSSATPVTSIVTGADVGGTVAEASRFALDPGAVLGGARYQTFTDENITILTSSSTATTVLAAQVPGDAFHRFSVDAKGTIGWGGGTAITDAYLAHLSGGGGDMELAPYLQIRGFFARTDPLLAMKQDGDAGFVWQVNADGTVAAGNGTGTPGWQFLPSNEAVTNVAPAGTQNINSTTFSSVTGVSCTITKHYANTRLKVALIGQGFVNVQPTNITVAVLVNGVDTQIDVFRYNVINQNQKFGGFVTISGLPAGTYTVQARLHVDVGTTTWTTGASVSGWSISAEEII